jgi:hypothetical protein
MAKTRTVSREVKEEWIRRIGKRYCSDQIPEKVKLPEAAVRSHKPDDHHLEQESSARLMVRLEAVRVLLEDVF